MPTHNPAPHSDLPVSGSELAQTSEGPRTYQSAWQWNADGTPKLMTAEEWLEEEAEVGNAINGPSRFVDDGPSREGVLRAIAQEVATLRAERSRWAASHTSLLSALRVAEQDAARYRFLRNSASWRAEYARGTHGDVMERWIDQALPSAVRCSFCGGGDRLVSGEQRGRVYICGGCAALCVEIFADHDAWTAAKGCRAGASVPAVYPSWSTPDAVAPTVASRSPQSETRDETG